VGALTFSYGSRRIEIVATEIFPSGYQEEEHDENSEDDSDRLRKSDRRGARL
jgi:hypothetical protein